MKRAAPTTLEIRNRATALLALIHIGIAITYLLTPPVRGEKRAVVVAYVEQLGPVWAGLFLISGTFLLLSRVTRRRMVGAHAFGMGVAVFYSSALWVSVFLRTPFAFTVAAWASLAVVGCHYVLSRWYAAGGER